MPASGRKNGPSFRGVVVQPKPKSTRGAANFALVCVTVFIIIGIVTVAWPYVQKLLAH